MKRAVPVVLALLVVALTSASASAQTGVAIPVVGTGQGGSFDGTFTLNRFVVVDNAVTAVGTLTGTVTNTAGTTTSILRTVTMPVQVGPTACEILHLDLGPLHLDLLGLQIDLSQVVLDITAQPGPGNLLGNLLCSVAGLLDNPSGLAGLLNKILDIL